MCQYVFMGSLEALPVIPHNEETPQFYIWKGDLAGIPDVAKPFFQDKYLYEAGSYMGCGCGLDSSEEYSDDDHDKRVADVKSLAMYLAAHCNENELILFSTWYDGFPETIEVVELDPKHIEPQNFEIPNDIVLRVVSTHLNE